MLTLAAAMLLAMGPGMLPARQDADADMQPSVPQASLAGPVDHSRLFFGWETVLIFRGLTLSGGTAREGVPGRGARLYFLGLVVVSLLMNAPWRRLRGTCPVRRAFRPRTLPLGSHAPPAAA